MLDSLDYWRLCDELTVVQAALLIVGEDPSQQYTYIEGWDIENRPQGYEAAKAAVSRALMSNIMDGTVVPEYETDMNGVVIGAITDSINVHSSTVVTYQLKNWLAERGIKSGFFFPAGDVEEADYMNFSHPRYAPKLAAAVNAWLALDSKDALSGKSPKQALLKWLRENGQDYGLTDEEGKPNELGIEECAKVANWQDKGGAPRTPSR